MSRRILLVVDSLFPLGDGYQLRILAEHLSGKHEIAICVVGSGKPSTQHHFTLSDIPTYCLASDEKLQHRSGAMKIQTALRLRRRIGAFNPDIVHAFGQTPTLIAAAALPANGQPKLLGSILSKWRPQNTMTQWVENCLVKRVDRFICAHDCLKKELLDFEIPEHKFTIVSNSVDPHADTRNDGQHQQHRSQLIATTGLDPSAFIAVASADLEPATRLKDLIWATDLLSCVRNDVHLVIFGKGSQHQRLLKFAACTEAAQHIHFADMPLSAEAMLGGADVYWNSHLQTPLPSTIFAAMSFGVPVISVYGPETAPLILHQETGFAVNYGARDEFARWTKFLIEKPDTAAQLANQGQQHVQQSFDAQQTVSAIEQIYDAI